MAKEDILLGGDYSEGNGNPPLSRAEELIQAHPDMMVIRARDNIRITQTFPDAQTYHDKYKLRHMWVDVEHEEGSQRHYPSVILVSFDYPSHYYFITDKAVLDIRQHGLLTVVKAHVEDDEQVTPEVVYKERLRYPRDFSAHQIRYIEEYSVPIPAQELVATAQAGLEMLNAYGEASFKQQERIDNLRTGIHGRPQIIDDTILYADGYIASASPLLGEFMRKQNMSFNHVGIKSIYALNVLNKVTDAMLPQEMPPAPKNRREPARRTRPPGR